MCQIGRTPSPLRYLTSKTLWNEGRKQWSRARSFSQLATRLCRLRRNQWFDLFSVSLSNPFWIHHFLWLWVCSLVACNVKRCFSLCFLVLVVGEIMNNLSLFFCMVVLILHISIVLFPSLHCSARRRNQFYCIKDAEAYPWLMCVRGCLAGLGRTALSGCGYFLTFL